MVEWGVLGEEMSIWEEEVYEDSKRGMFIV